MDGQAFQEDSESLDAQVAVLLTNAEEYAGNGDHKNELLCLSKAVSLAPEETTVVYRLGRAYSRLDFYEKAMEYYRKAEVLTPGDPSIQCSMGTVFMNQGNPVEARPFYEKALSLIGVDPQSSDTATTAVIYASYGLCLGRLGDKETAIKFFTLAKEKGFNQSSLDDYCKELQLNRNKV